MAKLPSISSRRVVKTFEAHGWQAVRQKGSHIVMVKEGTRGDIVSA